MTSTQQTNVETAKISQETLSPSKNENENEQSDAFNPETGEINWDCPCLGGMAKGSCGEQFKAAFSCFIYSKAEPKGVDCLEQFQKMKDCFREHPDEYGDELDDDDDDTEEEANLLQKTQKIQMCQKLRLLQLPRPLILLIILIQVINKSMKNPKNLKIENIIISA
ncbi:hypothetical protein GLOIN_2v1577915 [Rhizophagus irregularis DAOM 181602=DAOM 197198]|uniref:Mitochondrial intermembrane space import and assembly protein 40 n=1 Tax=Rhizophagus irregularis (strain DAOM 181602 / DAOM 197198 / MUCL 43194) TaxID=747089 RepID=A0A2P4Q9M0_RHIID|nr:hypothetical protein GLOIN_2v1577915 [Rhizophagus irregularis DAOM 181602=DAOM 197198]POG74331.1 hypothetical protein GLOIN_2v1577915 [Rhizophagus irregularis DAOM 181602=DAOM 197198]|eukprot:XP_025181197.1 hypothetical protein GLOIN_2v1577915 [Rhizophagus irregularis DAOM 181602=DAOM 197198]